MLNEREHSAPRPSPILRDEMLDAVATALDHLCYGDWPWHVRQAHKLVDLIEEQGYKVVGAAVPVCEWCGWVREDCVCPDLGSNPEGITT